MDIMQHKNIRFNADELIAYLTSNSIHFYRTTSQTGYVFTIVIDTTNDDDDVNSIITITYMRWGMEDNNDNPVYTLKHIVREHVEFIKSYVNAISDTIKGNFSEISYNEGYAITSDGINKLVQIMNFDSKDAWSG